mmetsp:Transcript_21084/g.51878  ORF Transcript_21084/g.51878 Transcript_21084/m.51878 type:complete len:288 (+) Transcript_21084:549-1412(+)
MGAINIPLSPESGLQNNTFPANLTGYMETGEWDEFARKIWKVCKEYRESVQSRNGRSCMIIILVLVASGIIGVVGELGAAILLFVVVIAVMACVECNCNPANADRKRCVASLKQVCKRSSSDQVSFHLLSQGHTVLTRHDGGPRHGYYYSSNEEKDYYVSIVTSQLEPTSSMRPQKQSSANRYTAPPGYDTDKCSTEQPEEEKNWEDPESQQQTNDAQKHKKPKKKKKKKRKSGARTSVAPAEDAMESGQQERKEDLVTRLSVLEQMKPMLTPGEYAEKKAEILKSL